MEQRNHPEGIGGLHPQTAERTTEISRNGGETEEAGEHQPISAAQDTGTDLNQSVIFCTLIGPGN